MTPASPENRGQEQERSLLARMVLNTRSFGLLMTALAVYLLASEKEIIARTGHGGSKSAVLPLTLCMGIAFAADPNLRRPWIAAIMLIAGFVGGVAWFWLWG